MWLEKLQEARKARKVTIKWIAEQADYSERKITKLFSGEYKDPSAQLLYDVGALFGLDLNDLLGDGNSVVTSQTLAELHTRIEALEIENARLCGKCFAVRVEGERFSVTVNGMTRTAAIGESITI